MNHSALGTIRGTTIQLDTNLGLADGERVEVSVKVRPSVAEKGIEGLLRSAGALATEWTDEDDKILEEIYRDRKNDRRPEIEP